MYFVKVLGGAEGKFSRRRVEKVLEIRWIGWDLGVVGVFGVLGRWLRLRLVGGLGSRGVLVVV